MRSYRVPQVVIDPVRKSFEATEVFIPLDGPLPEFEPAPDDQQQEESEADHG